MLHPQCVADVATAHLSKRPSQTAPVHAHAVHSCSMNQCATLGQPQSRHRKRQCCPRVCCANTAATTCNNQRTLQCACAQHMPYSAAPAQALQQQQEPCACSESPHKPMPRSSSSSSAVLTASLRVTSMAPAPRTPGSLRQGP
jgi:hypothetical protein